MQVRSLEGDTLDALCHRHLGTTSGCVVAQAYGLNRGLAAQCGPSGIVPTGTLVTLPDPSNQTTATSVVTLWD
jgi:phage tail protein X